jgi:hypothetical protein
MLRVEGDETAGQRKFCTVCRRIRVAICNNTFSIHSELHWVIVNVTTERGLVILNEDTTRWRELELEMGVNPSNDGKDREGKELGLTVHSERRGTLEYFHCFPLIFIHSKPTL